MNPEFLKDLNLSQKDYEEICFRLGRTPKPVELGLFSAMWSEHCSYRSSGSYLKQLPVKGRQVVQGPGENAGVIEIKKDLYLAFKVESHNHPSAVEPFQGAATGVGGIIRDIFTMGARPIGVLDSLSFDYPSHARSRYLLHGVVDGISFYGNCVGVPNLGGETHFHHCYAENPLVNVMCLGLLKKDQLRSSVAKSVGASVIYIGAKTGRDGIHGASFASGVLDDEAKKRKSSVQVGDPFLEKLLIEATLEIIQLDLIEAIQDMGAAGLTSSAVEMAGKGGRGIELHVEKVPLRESDISPFEMMLSESQERMLLIAKPGKTNQIQAILEKWQLDYAEIGTITNTGHIDIFYHHEQVCHVSIPELLNAPISSVTPRRDSSVQSDFQELLPPLASDWEKWILDYCSKADQGTKDWIFEQYDTTLLSNTVRPPGYGASLIHIKDESLYLGVTLNSFGHWCAVDPMQGVMAVLSMASRRLSALGCEASAITNGLNFGDPLKAHTMWEFSETIQGMKNWLEFFDVPVISGNVSFYNEGENSRIFPTPVIGMVGQSNDLRPLPAVLKETGLCLAVVGSTENERFSSKSLPRLDLQKEKDTQNIVRTLIKDEKIRFCRSLDEGGLIKAILGIIAQGSCGICLDQDLPIALDAFLCSESHSRFLIAYQSSLENDIKQLLLPISLTPIGKTKDDPFFAISTIQLSLDLLRQTMKNAFSQWMQAGMIHTTEKSQ